MQLASAPRDNNYATDAFFGIGQLGPEALRSSVDARLSPSRATRPSSGLWLLARRSSCLEDVAVCDQVVVMDGGVVAQKGAPFDLLEDSGGKFAALAAELGTGVLERIRAVAQAANDRGAASVK